MTHEVSHNMLHDSSNNFPVINAVKPGHVTHKSAMIQAGIGMDDRFTNAKVLIDTGADFNAMSASFYRFLKSRGFHVKLLPSRQKTPPTAANSQPVKVVGDCVLDVQLTSQDGKTTVIRKIRFVVIVNLNASCIIGICTLRELGLLIKGTRMEVAGHRVCTMSNRKSIQFMDLVEIDGTKWGLYSDLTKSVGADFQMSAKGSNRMNQLLSTYSERCSSEYSPNEMKVGDYLVNLGTADDPPSELTIWEDHTKILNELKHCNNQNEGRKLITDDGLPANMSRNFLNILEGFQNVEESLNGPEGQYVEDC